ncbi:MAG: DUF4248 domain-containing protein [Bacteroides sp.]|nr:DUF4248 domain-containing protein [Bacteroides sp.]
MNESVFRSGIEGGAAGALPKVVLARLYLPERSPRMALRTFNKWISSHQVLTEQLAQTGYTPHCRLLTPEQVRLMVLYLGEP